MTAERNAGFSLVEVLVALSLLSLLSSALLSTLISSMRYDAASQRRLDAAMHAVDVIERIKGGRPVPTSESADLLKVRVDRSPWGMGIEKVAVIVSWQKPFEGVFRLVTLVTPPPLA